MWVVVLVSQLVPSSDEVHHLPHTPLPREEHWDLSSPDPSGLFQSSFVVGELDSVVEPLVLCGKSVRETEMIHVKEERNGLCS